MWNTEAKWGIFIYLHTRNCRKKLPHLCTRGFIRRTQLPTNKALMQLILAIRAHKSWNSLPDNLSHASSWDTWFNRHKIRYCSPAHKEMSQIHNEKKKKRLHVEGKEKQSGLKKVISYFNLVICITKRFTKRTSPRFYSWMKGSHAAPFTTASSKKQKLKE